MKLFSTLSRWFIPREVLTVNDVFNRMVDAKTKQGLRPKSIQGINNKLRRLVEMYGAKDIRKITPDDISAMLDNPSWGHRTRWDMLLMASSLFAFAIKWRLVDSNPCDVVEKPVLEYR